MAGIVDEVRARAACAELFQSGEAGTRCLLDRPVVREMVGAIRENLSGLGYLPNSTVAVQAIAFDKTPEANWKVTWHQDLMFPFARKVRSEGYALPAQKEGVHYARPPLAVLESLLAVRIHLDDCDEGNGPLRVAPGTHRRGIIPSAEIAEMVARQAAVTCVAKSGEALLMRPLLLHASSPATVPKHRRVLHLVYYGGEAMSEQWHRAI